MDASVCETTVGQPICHTLESKDKIKICNEVKKLGYIQDMAIGSFFVTIKWMITLSKTQMIVILVIFAFSKIANIIAFMTHQQYIYTNSASCTKFKNIEFLILVNRQGISNCFLRNKNSLLYLLLHIR